MFIEAKDDDGGGGDNWCYKSCKAPVKSSPPTNQHPVFYRLDALPVARPTVSKHWRENITFHGLAYPGSPGGLPTFYLWPLIVPGYLGEGCHASHQPSDASTLSMASFPGGPRLPGTRMSPVRILLELRMKEVVETTRATEHAKLQSTNIPTSQGLDRLGLIINLLPFKPNPVLPVQFSSVQFARISVVQSVSSSGPRNSNQCYPCSCRWNRKVFRSRRWPHSGRRNARGRSKPFRLTSNWLDADSRLGPRYLHHPVKHRLAAFQFN